MKARRGWVERIGRVGKAQRADGTRTYAWDAEQRLVRIGYTGTGRSTTFRYDGLGRRTAVIENDGATATETRYLWCGERLCQARDATDTVTRRYYDEGELAVAATGDVAAFYAEDHLGSIRDLRLGDGQVLASYDYDPYGTPTRSDETGGIRADYRYAGLVNHAQSGLYLANYRAYSPQTGRWISRDPIFEAGGVNLYAYVGGNPLRWIDPLGLAVQICSKIWRPHTFICVDGNCSGKYPSGNPFASPGEIRNDSDNKSSARCSNVPNQKSDQNCFERCIAKRITQRGPSGDLYNYSAANCGQWAEGVILECRSQCTK